MLCLIVFLMACGKKTPSEKAAAELHLTTTRIRGFDPAMAMDQASALAVGKVFEGLLQYSYWERPYQVEPLLAADMPEISDDGLLYRFTLRRGIYFADDPCFAATGGIGRELTAEDLVYSIKRIADTKVGSGGYWVFRNRIRGLDEFRTQSASAEPTDYSWVVDGLRAPDRYTLEIHLTAPYPQLLWVMTMPYAYAVAREAVEFYGSDFMNHPVGTGPYILESAQQNYRYAYITNPKWAETGRRDCVPAAAPTPDAGAALPLTPRIIEWVVGDPATAWLLFLSGDLDLSDIRRDNWDSVIGPGGTLLPDLEQRGVRLEKAPRMVVSYMSFNMDDPVVGKNKKLRQAMTSAFNTRAWVAFQNGRVARPNGPIPPGISGYSENPEHYPFDLAAARRLLAEAGFPDGIDPQTGRRLTLVLDTGQADDPEARQAAELMANFFNAIGLDVRLQHQNWPTFLEKLERRQSQLFILSWIGDYPDAQNFLQLFYSRNVSPGPNRANYRNPAFDHLFEQIATMQDGPERRALCAESTRILTEDCPWIFTAFPVTYKLHQPWLQNYIYHDFPYGMEKYYKIAR